MKLYAIKTRVIKTGDNIVDKVLQAIKKQKLCLEDGDILAFASKVVACVEGRTVNLNNVKPSSEAEKLARRFSIKPQLAELILREADEIHGGVEKAVLTIKNGVLVPNAGIDNKNTPENSVTLWPGNPKKSARIIRSEIKKKTGKKVAVLIVDSSLRPLRLGTTGLALASAGFKPIKDYRGKKDIYKKTMNITLHAIADDLASAAHFMMGESAEKTPAVLIKNAQVEFTEEAYGPEEMKISSEECIFMNSLVEKREKP
ncbi:coenzyme F420-0:L-glutamate ligase [Candidatus Bathyarchaeota archaeon]|nr:coenzyme F420-0:L-glutamate ligase [Candidatus Bathyarchaeota archaeon]